MPAFGFNTFIGMKNCFSIFQGTGNKLVNIPAKVTKLLTTQKSDGNFSTSLFKLSQQTLKKYFEDKMLHHQDGDITELAL